jgi:choice-of-anchor A domain-containing protein
MYLGNRVPVLVPLVGVLSIPASLFAATHSPCIPGDGLPASTSAVVAGVCSQDPSCCNVRWTLTCVERATLVARRTGVSPDLCGRDAWTMGPVPGTAQFYPRDFCMLALGDPQDPSYPADITAFQDAQCPVAARGTIRTADFDMNWGEGEPVAAIAGGGLDLQRGTVHGQAYYGDPSKYISRGVNYHQISTKFPASSFQPTISPALSADRIDFVDAAAKLRALSATIKSFTDGMSRSSPYYGANRYGSIIMTGSDRQMNVFWTEASQLANAYQITINVPVGSTAIVNVTGTNPAISSAGFVRPGLVRRTFYGISPMPRPSTSDPSHGRARSSRPMQKRICGGARSAEASS